MAKKVFMPEDLAQAEREEVQDNLMAARDEISRLNGRRRRLVEIMFKNPGMDFIQAARLAGYSISDKARASVIKRDIAGKLSATLRELGLFETDLAAAIRDGLKATKVTFLRKQEVVDGKIVNKIEAVETPDHATRLQAAKMLAFLGNYFPPKQINVEHTEANPYKGMPREILLARAEELRRMEIDADFEDVTGQIKMDAGPVGEIPDKRGTGQDQSADIRQ